METGHAGTGLAGTAVSITTSSSPQSFDAYGPANPGSPENMAIKLK